MQQTRLQTQATPLEDLRVRSHPIPHLSAPAEHPHQVRPVDYASARQVPLSQEPACLCFGWFGVDRELKGRRQYVPPLVELVVKLCHHGREAV